VATAALPTMMKVTDSDANERRRRWMTVIVAPVATGSRINEEEE